MESITFSVLMANYNNSRFIKESIESVISQTHQEWELIIVDDCSTDNSIDIIQPYLKDKRIKLIRHKRNHGYGGSLKTAAANSTMNVLAILDADDKLTSDALEVVSKGYLENFGVGFVYSTMWECDSILNPLSIALWIGPIYQIGTNLFKQKVSHFKTFLKELYLKTTGFDPAFKSAVDIDIICKLEEITDFYFINKPLYYYRIHESGVSRGERRFQARIELYITRCKAYKRRINTSIPNLTLKSLYYEYFKITLYKMNHFLIQLMKYIKIKLIYEKITIKYPKIKKSILKMKVLKDIIDKI